MNAMVQRLSLSEPQVRLSPRIAMGWEEKGNGMEPNTLARALGWFSIGLGALEIFGGEPLAKSLGMEKQSSLLRAYGVRETGVGIGILTAREPIPPGWLWARFGGDILDIATLLSALEGNPKRANVMVALAAVGGVTVLDYVSARQLTP